MVVPENRSNVLSGVGPSPEPYEILAIIRGLLEETNEILSSHVSSNIGMDTTEAIREMNG